MQTTKINPVLFGLLGGVITYIILYFDTILESNNSENSLSIFDQDLFTDVPDF